MVEVHGVAVAACRVACRIVRRGALQATATLAVLAMALPLAATPARAQSAWPDRPIRVIVPVPPGGTPDVVARLVVTPMAARLGQPMIIDNRGGAGGLIGAEVAAKALPDGHTLFLSSPGPLAILPHLQKKAAYDPINDFTPIGLISSGPFLLIAHPRCRPVASANCSRWRAPSRAGSTMPRPATARPTTLRWSCSSRWRA